MDITRKTSSFPPPAEGDQEDWDLEILQAMVAPSTAEDAALACAAAWMNFVRAERVAVAVFETPSSCIVAHGQREDGHLTIYVGHEKAHVSALLRPELLFTDNGPCVIEKPTYTLCWREHCSAILAVTDEDTVEEARIELVKTISRTLLSRWTTPATSFANPEHMEAMAEFSAGAGHEINNPLGSIVGQTQLLLKRETRSDYKQALETIGAQAWRIRDMIGDAMLFARPPQPEFVECDLVNIARKAVTAMNATFAGGSELAQLQVSHHSITTFADESQLATLISHLVRNACEAVQDNDGTKTILVEIKKEADYAASLTVRDNGPEIPAEVRSHLFDPFYSGRQAGRGLGFGLCHCWQITRMHNGILMQESLNDGNQFLVVLPIETTESSQ